MKKIGQLLLISLVCLLTVCSGADVVGNFDSLDAMVKRSDVILLIRIKEHIEPQHPERPNTSYAQSEERCEVLKTLKGNVTEHSVIPVHLFDGDFVLPDRFRRGTCHVVFLSNGIYNNGKPDLDAQGNVRYFSLKYQNNNIEVSPKCDPKALAGKSIAESIKILIDDYRAY